MDITITIEDAYIDELLPTGGDLWCWPYNPDVSEDIEGRAHKLGEAFSWWEKDISQAILSEVGKRITQRKKEKREA